MTTEIENKSNVTLTESKLVLHPDVKAKVESKKWFYTDTVKDHFFNPRNLLMNDEDGEEYAKIADGIGMVGSPACIAGDTLIAVADGRVAVTIKQLVEDGKNVQVYCYGEEQIQVRTARFFRKTRTNAIVWRVTLNDGSSFKATPDHSLMLPDGSYKMLNELKVGDCLIPFNNNLVEYENGEVQLIKTQNIFKTINSIEVSGYEDVYNTTVDDFHNYAIITDKENLSGIIVKNCGDAMKIWIKVDKENDKITECKFQTFGSLLPGARILMSDYTTKVVEELAIGDEIIDGNGKRNYVEEILTKEYDNKVITIKPSTSNFYGITVTPNHPIPCVSRRALAVINENRNVKNWYELKVQEEFVNGTEISTLPACEIKEGDFLIFNIPKEVEDIKELNEDMCTLLGYYVSDGNAPSNSRVIFYFDLDVKEYNNEIENITKKYGWDYVVYPRKNYTGLCIQINEPKVTQMLRKYGGTPNKKRFAEYIMRLPPLKQMLIIDSYVKGDGWETKQEEGWNTQYFISTSIEHLAFQLQIMLARNWIFAPIHKRKPRSFIIRGKEYTNSGEYNVIFKKLQQHSRIKIDFEGGNFLIPISKIVVSDYVGKIYDIGIVNEPHTYRVNGISLHNCASAIASTSMLTVMVTENGGMKIEDSLKLKPQDIIKRLENLPNRKFHCSVLGDKALRSAINDYFRRSGQTSRIIVEGARIVDPDTKTTDKDIEEAVLDGALTVEDVQKKLKVGISNKAVIPAVEELIRFYKEKYFG